MKQHGPWQIRDSREVYCDPWLHVRKDDVIRPDGEAGTHCLVTVKPGVSILPVDDEMNVYLAEEFHYAIGRVNLEVVSGGREPEEDPLDTAKRELQEELGITANEWIDLGIVDPFTSLVVSPTQIFLARQIGFGRRAPEGTETIHLRKCTLADAVKKVLASEITHGPSCVLILKAERWLQANVSPRAPE
jgi:ADP-ribose pyrophosphatase